jgi:TP901 family phage tail tape measure protein
MARSQLKFIIGADITQAEKAFKEIGNAIDRAGKKLKNFGKAYGAAISAPVIAIGGLAVKAGLGIDDALDDIRIGTGAVGKALKGLEADFKAIAVAVPQSLGDSSKAIADFNTLTGATGEELQNMSIAALDASRMMKKDLGGVIASTGKLLNNWKIPINQSVQLMDKLFVASQSTGLGMDEIASGVTKSGNALRQMGFSIDEAIALIANLDREGIQTDQIFKSLTKALAMLSKAGITNTSQAFTEIVNSIRTAKTNSEATTRAMEIFGSKAGPEMAAAIREGRFSVDDLVTSLRNAEGAIRKTAEDTDGFSEKWQRLSNELSVALEPLGTKLLSMAEKEMPALSQAIHNYAVNLDAGTIKTIALAAAIGPATLAAGAFVSGIASLIKAFGGMVSLLSSPAGIPVLIAAGVAFGNVKGEMEETERQAKFTAAAMKEVFDQFGNANTSMINAELGKVTAEFETLSEKVKLFKEEVNDGLLMGAVIATDIRNINPDLDRLDALEAKKKVLRDTILDKVEAADLAKTAPVSPAVRAILKAPKRKTPKEIEAEIRAILDKLLKGNDGTKSKSFSLAEIFAGTARDHMTYMGEPGTKFLAQLDAMQAKLKPLSDGWKILQDLRLDIEDEEFNKKIQSFQDRIQYLGENGIDFLPDLESMKVKFAPLSEEGKKLADVIKNIADTDAQKKWSDMSWNFSQGLLSSKEYAAILQTEIGKLAQGTGEWKERFSELQSIKSLEIDKQLESLSTQFEVGKLSGAEYESALESLAGQYSDFPLAVRQASDALRTFQEQSEITAVSTGKALSDALRGVTKDFEELQGKGILGAVDGFLRAAISGEDFGESLRRLGEDIIYTTLRMIILQSLTKMFGGAFGGIGGGGASLTAATPSAKGNVFLSGNIVPFSKGGVVPRPTVFPMANGAGLMSEAGPEAIMPLKRDSRGRLGVSAEGSSGGGVVVNVDNRTSTPIDAGNVDVSSDDMERIVIGIMLKDQAKNGPVTRNYRR